MKTSINLDNLRVASPCPVGWDSMSGTDQVRFCSQCRLNVYNISELTSAEAEQLIASTEGGICGRIYRRADGTLITKDCPVGLRELRRRVSRRAAAVLALMTSLASVVTAQKRTRPWPWEKQIKVTEKTIKSDCDQAEFTGLVVDPNGAVIPSAKVTITNRDTSDIRVTETTDEGKFKFADLTSGRYAIEISANGFQSFKQREVFFDKNQAINVEVILSVAASTTVIVGFIPRISEPAIDTTKPGGTTVLRGDVIRNLPLP